MELPTKDTPPFPADFSPVHLDTLRTLVCYITGRSKSKSLCDKTHDVKDTDISNFKKGGNLGWPANTGKILQLYISVHKWFIFDENGRNHTEIMRPVIYRLYYPDEIPALAYRMISRLTGLYEQGIREAAKFMPGVYYVYRYGSCVSGEPEIAKSVLQITVSFSQGILEPQLHFRLWYMKGRLGDRHEAGLITGMVAPKWKHTFFIGVDRANNDAPFMMIIRGNFRGINNKNGGEEPVRLAHGLLLRVNTREATMAARVFLSRVDEDHGRHDTSHIESLTNERWHDARVIPRKDLTPEELKNEEMFMNKIDNEKTFVLWDYGVDE